MSFPYNMVKMFKSDENTIVFYIDDCSNQNRKVSLSYLFPNISIESNVTIKQKILKKAHTEGYICIAYFSKIWIVLNFTTPSDPTKWQDIPLLNTTEKFNINSNFLMIDHKNLITKLIKHP